MTSSKRVGFEAHRLLGDGTRTLVLRMLGVGLLFGLHVLLGNVLGPEQYGLYSFALSIAGVLLTVGGLGLPKALLRYIGQYKEQGRRSELKGALRQLPVLALLSAGLISALMLVSVGPFVGIKSWAIGVEYAAFLLPVFVVEQIRRSIYKGFARPLSSVLPDEVLRPLILGSCVWLVGVNDGVGVLHWYIGITIGMASIFLVWIYSAERGALSSCVATYRTREWIGTALPLAVGGIGFLVMNRTDVIMLGLLADMPVVGVYAAANRVAALLQIVLSTSAVVVVPMITAAYHGGRLHEFTQLLSDARKWIVSLTLPAFAIMLAVPGFLLGMFGEEYVEGSGILRILAAGQFVNAVAGPLGLALSMSGGQKVLAIVMICAAALNIVLNAIAIPIWGATGAASVTMLCLVITNAALYVIIRRSTSAAAPPTPDPSYD